jgi:hypothetical protein
MGVAAKFRFGTTMTAIASTLAALFVALPPGPAAAPATPSVHGRVPSFERSGRVDSDHDGLTNWFERHRSHTNPHRRDTDGDGYSDRREVRAGSNPRDRNSFPGSRQHDPGKSSPPAAATSSSEPEPSTPGAPPSTPTPRATAVWHGPAGARVDVPVTLDGTASTGSGPLTCTWSFENRDGSAVYQTRSGCAIDFTFEDVGTKYVALEVRDAAGESDSDKQSFRVTEGPAEEGEGSPESPEPPEEEPPAEPPPASGSHCFTEPHLCGYPDPTNTGLPAGTSLTPSGSIVASTPGQTIGGREVTGTINVTANNVTIEDTRVTQTDSCGTVNTCGNYAIRIDEGVTGTVIRDVETRSQAGDTCEHDIRNTSTSPVTIERAYMHACDSNVYGTATLRDSYGIAKIAISTDHVENVYVCGTTIDVEHSTLFNPVDQTAVVFGDALCGANHYTVRNSLLAGGGYVFYPQANASPTSGQTIITGNHIARCLSAETPAKSGGNWLCKNGADPGGYYPRGGSFGIGAFFSGPLTWSGNVWDDSLAPLCSDGRPGCG